MNNKGFAITGIIYTLFILFLMILLTVLTGLSSYQRLMINSTSSLESSFEGKKIGDDPSDSYYDFYDIKNDKKAYYLGKYVFKTDDNKDGIINNYDDLECSVYLKKGTDFSGIDIDTTDDFSKNIARLSPDICNNDEFYMVLDRVYSFEGDKNEKN